MIRLSVLKDSEKHFTEECEQLMKEKESLEARVYIFVLL